MINNPTGTNEHTNVHLSTPARAKFTYINMHACACVYIYICELYTVILVYLGIGKMDMYPDTLSMRDQNLQNYLKLKRIPKIWFKLLKII